MRYNVPVNGRLNSDAILLTFAYMNDLAVSLTLTGQSYCKRKGNALRHTPSYDHTFIFNL